MSETNTAGAIRNPYTPQQMEAMRLAARGLTLTAAADGCTVRGRTADDVRRLTGMVLAVGGNTAGAASAGWGIPKAAGAGFVATFPAAAKKGLPFLDWNTAGAARRPAGPIITAVSKDALVRKIARLSMRLGATRIDAPLRLPGGMWFVPAPAAWAARINSASGNRAGELACPEGQHAEFDVFDTDGIPFVTCVFDATGTDPVVTVQCGAGEVQIRSGTFAGQCVLPGSPCSRDDGPGFWTTDGECAPAGTTTTTTTTTTGPPKPDPIVRTPPPTTTTPTTSFWDGNGPYYGAAALALLAVGGGIYLGKKKKRSKNPPTKRKGKKKRSPHNENGLSYERWLAASGRSKTSASLRKAWHAGEDPSDYRVNRAHPYD